MNLYPADLVFDPRINLNTLHQSKGLTNMVRSDGQWVTYCMRHKIGYEITVNGKIIQFPTHHH